MASATSSSLTATMSSASRRTTSSACGSAMRQAMPSASTVSTGASTTHRARKESRKDVACAETTPTRRLVRPVNARAAAAAQKPEPWPIGTYTTAGSSPAGKLSKNSSQ